MTFVGRNDTVMRLGSILSGRERAEGKITCYPPYVLALWQCILPVTALYCRDSRAGPCHGAPDTYEGRHQQNGIITVRHPSM